jgi:hypothetical protein
MVQRSPAHVVRSETLMDVGMAGLCFEAAVRGGMTTNKADTIFASRPYAILQEFRSAAGHPSFVPALVRAEFHMLPVPLPFLAP